MPTSRTIPNRNIDNVGMTHRRRTDEPTAPITATALSRRKPISKLLEEVVAKRNNAPTRTEA